MTGRVEHVEGLKHQMNVIVAANDVEKAYQKKLGEVAKQASLKGFRRGKVPSKVVEQKFGKDILREIAVNLIQSKFDEDVKANDLKVAGSPDIDVDLSALTKNKDIEFTAKFEVFPTITLKELAGVDIESPSAEVTDEDVNAELIKLRTQHTSWKAVDRAAKLGDRVQVDFEGSVDNEPLDKGNAKDMWIELGSNSMIPGFEDGLIGVTKDSEKELSLTFPENYHVDTLKSKPALFKVKVHAVEEPALPALDDAFAEKAGVKEGGVDQLKKNVKERLQAELKKQIESTFKENVLDKLLELNPIEVPTALVNMEIKNLQQITRQQMKYYFPNMPDQQLAQLPLGDEQYVDEAKKRVKLGLLLSEFIKSKGLKADKDVVTAKIDEIAQGYPNNAAEVRNYYLNNEKLYAEVEAYALEQQAVTLLTQGAHVIEAKKTFDAIMNADKAE